MGVQPDVRNIASELGEEPDVVDMISNDPSLLKEDGDTAIGLGSEVTMTETEVNLGKFN